MAITISPVLTSVILKLQNEFATALPTIDVFFREVIGYDQNTDFIMVGSDGDPESDTEATFEISWVDLGQTRKRETGEVPCVLVSQIGDDDPVSALQSASVTLTACVSSLVNDRTLGGVCMDSQVTGGSARIVQNTEGTAIVLPFTVSYWAHV